MTDDEAPDWGLALAYEVDIRQAAREAARAYSGAIPEQDLAQDGLLYVATHPDAMRRQLKKGGPGYLRRSVRSELRRRSGREKAQACAPYDNGKL